MPDKSKSTPTEETEKREEQLEREDSSLLPRDLPGMQPDSALGNRKPEAGKRLPLELGMSQSELALLLGASRPKINEALGKLEETGAINRTIDRIFCDPAKLADIDGANA